MVKVSEVLKCFVNSVWQENLLDGKSWYPWRVETRQKVAGNISCHELVVEDDPGGLSLTQVNSR